MFRIVPYRKVSELDTRLKEYLDLDAGACFIVPSRRDRDWWRVRVGAREYGLEAERAGNLRNWEDLYNELCEFLGCPRLRQIDPPDHRLILSHIVGTFLKEEPELVRERPGLARPGFIDILSDDIRELINEDISVEQLEATLIGEKTTSGILPRLYRRYLDYLAGNRLMDSAQIPRMTADLLRTAGERWNESMTFVFVGFMSFTHAQLNLLRELEGPYRDTVVYKPEAELTSFQDAAVQFKKNVGIGEDPLPPSSGRLVSLGVSDYGLEPEAVARELALWQAGRGILSALPDNPFPGFGSIGMLVPERREAAMEAALRRYRIPCLPARGRSVGRTLLGKNLSPIWTAWIQGLEPYETALLLTQPCISGNADFSVDEAVAAGPRGIRGWESYLEYRAASASGGPRKKDARHVLRAFKAMTKFCRALEKGSTPEGIFSALHAFLTTPGLWTDALAAMPLTSPDLDENLRELASSVAEVDAKRLALRELQPDLGVAGDIVLKGGEAVGFLGNWCEETLVRPAPPLDGAVTLYTGVPPILASWPVWIMIDVTQKNWPGTWNPSPLLGAEDRERMRDASAWLPSAHDRRMQREALFRRLLQTGENLTLASYSATDEEGRPAGASSLLPSFIEDMKLWELIEPPVVRLAGLLPSEGDFFFPSIEVPLSDRIERGMPVLHAGELPRTKDARLRLPVSDLYELLDCPFRYRIRRHIRLRERRAGLFDSAEAGQLTHKIWENVWKRRAQDPLPLPELASGEWTKALSRTEGYESFGQLLSDTRLTRHLKNLEFCISRLATLQQDILDRLLLSGFVHSSLYMEELEMSVERDGVLFTGRCDRVEILNGRLAVIVDYKLGKSSSYEKKLPGLTSRPYLRELPEGREAFRFGLQLSAYALMYRSRFPDHEVVGVGFLGHGDGSLAGTFAPSVAGCYLPDGKSGPMEERIAEAEIAMSCAAGILKSGRYEPCYPAESCRYCDMKGICRKGELRGEALAGIDEENDDENETENGDERLAD